jgi:hypothetical protein
MNKTTQKDSSDSKSPNSLAVILLDDRGTNWRALVRSGAK